MPLFIRGVRNNGLSWDDLPRCSVDDEARQVSRRLVANWKADRARKRKPNFGWTLLRTYGHMYVLPFTVFAFEVSHKDVDFSYFGSKLYSTTTTTTYRN